MKYKQLLGIIGSTILFLGVFCPIISSPVLGNMNYFQNGSGDGVAILILAIVSLILTVQKKYKFIWLSSLLSAVVILFTYIKFQSSDFLSKEFPIEIMPQLQWGWIFLVIGIVLLICCVVLKDNNSDEKGASMFPCSECGKEIHITAPVCPQCGTPNATSNNMPMVSCIGCGTEIYVTALACHQCGAPNNPQKIFVKIRRLVLPYAVVVTIMAISIGAVAMLSLGAVYNADKELYNYGVHTTGDAGDVGISLYRMRVRIRDTVVYPERVKQTREDYEGFYKKLTVAQDSLYERVRDKQAVEELRQKTKFYYDNALPVFELTAQGRMREARETMAGSALVGSARDADQAILDIQRVVDDNVSAIVTNNMATARIMHWLLTVTLIIGIGTIVIIACYLAE